MQNGILCITAKIWKTLPFDIDGSNNFEKSSLCKVLNNEFSPLLNDKDLLTYRMDLTADNGDKAYGTFFVHVGLLSANLYRKYRDHIPCYHDWLWLCTPRACSDKVGFVQTVSPIDRLDTYDANGNICVVPTVVFKKDTHIQLHNS